MPSLNLPNIRNVQSTSVGKLLLSHAPSQAQLSNRLPKLASNSRTRLHAREISCCSEKLLMTIVAIDAHWLPKPQGIMKNQYFGDRNDYFKYDLLISLAGQLAVKRLSIIWMLTEDDDSQHGEKTKYARGAGDRRLYQSLRRSLNEGSRNVGQLRNFLQEGGYEFDYCPYGEERLFGHQERDSYFERIPEESLAGSVVFLDPDIGLEAKSMGAKDGPNYVTYDEVASICGRMEETSVLVTYQHLPHVHRRLFLYRTADKLMQRLKCPMPVSISDNQIAFIILAKTKKRQEEVRKALHEYTRSHLDIFD